MNCATVKIMTSAKSELCGAATLQHDASDRHLHSGVSSSPGRSRRTAWDLHELIRPMPVRQKPACRRPRLLNHYPQIVQFVYQHRFATADQIQRRFPEQIQSTRTCQYQLASLVQLGLLAQAPVRSTAPHFPFVYYTTRPGVRLLREHTDSDNLTATEDVRHRGCSLHSILHELLLTEFELSVWESVQSHPDLHLHFTERRYFRRENQLRFTHQGESHRVIPDAGFLLENKSPESSSTLLHFVELDNNTMSLARIREKFERYNNWARSDEGERYMANLYTEYGVFPKRPTFRLLVITNAESRKAGQQRLSNLASQAIHLPSAMRKRMWLTTLPNPNFVPSDESLTATMWCRVFGVTCRDQHDCQIVAGSSSRRALARTHSS